MLFLTQGINTKYDDYRDPRTWSILLASKFVEMDEILGVNAFSEDILRDPSQVDMVKSRGLILFVWMDEKDSDRETVQYLKQLGVDGIVYDRIDMQKDKGKESIFFTDHKMQMEEAAAAAAAREGDAASTCSCSSSKSGGSSPAQVLKKTSQKVYEGIT